MLVSRLSSSLRVLLLLGALAFLLGGYALVRAVTPPTTWTVYITKNHGTVHASVEEALREFLFREVRKQPTGSISCTRYQYYWAIGAAYNSPGSYFDAKFTNGEMTTPCVGPTISSKPWFEVDAVVSALSCSASSTDERCYALRSTPKEAGEPDRPCQVSCGNPINPATGNKFQKEVDFEVPGSPLLSFVRYYNSTTAAAGGSVLGTRWRHSFEYVLEKQVDGTIRLHRPDASVKTFAPGRVADLDEEGFLDLRLDTAGNAIGWTYDNRAGQVESYDTAGRILRIDFTQGGFLVFAYAANSILPSAVTDHFGRTLTFVYSGAKLTSVTGPDGVVYAFAYNGGGRLSSVNKGGSGTRQYLYDEGSLTSTSVYGYLTGIVDEAGKRFASFGYDNRGRAVLTTHAGAAERYLLVYNADDSVVVTTPSGAAQTLTFSRILGVNRLVSSVTRCASATCTAELGVVNAYDANGNITAVTKTDGTMSCIAYNERNLPTRVVEHLPAGTSCATALSTPPAVSPVRTTTTEWHPTLRAPTKVVGPASQAVFGYDASGRVASIASSATAGNGSGSEGTQVGTVWLTQTVTFGYNANGQVTSIDGPRTDANDVTTLLYDAAGNLLSVTDPAGLQTQFTAYDTMGRPTAITHSTGAQESRAYSPRGWLVQRSLAGEVTNLQYDNRGLLAVAQLPSGMALSYTYDDAQRLVSVTDQRGNKREVVLNQAGSPLSTVLKRSDGATVRQLQIVRDELNRVLTMTGAHVVNPAGGLFAE